MLYEGEREGWKLIQLNSVFRSLRGDFSLPLQDPISKILPLIFFTNTKKLYSSNNLSFRCLFKNNFYLFLILNVCENIVMLTPIFLSTYFLKSINLTSSNSCPLFFCFFVLFYSLIPIRAVRMVMGVWPTTIAVTTHSKRE